MKTFLTSYYYINSTSLEHTWNGPMGTKETVSYSMALFLMVNDCGQNGASLLSSSSHILVIIINFPVDQSVGNYYRPHPKDGGR